MLDTKLTLPSISVDTESIQEIINQAVENSVLATVTKLTQDPAWMDKLDRKMTQAVVQRTVATLGSVDIGEMVVARVNDIFQQRLLSNFASTGIDDQATSCQLTIFDDATVVENQLTAKDISVVGTATVNDLVINGSINTDNRSWDILAAAISNKTLTKLNEQWHEQLINQVKQDIQNNGIAFDTVKIGDELLVSDGHLSSAVTSSNLQKLGILSALHVRGEVLLNDSVTVTRRRLGINTQDPESALSIWDEEVSIIAGKHKAQEAFVGTAKNQTLHLGVDRKPHVTIDTDGLTTVKKLRIGQHTISYDSQVPGWSGTRGDIVFNNNPVPNSPFAWVCLGGFKWKTLQAVE